MAKAKTITNALKALKDQYRKIGDEIWEIENAEKQKRLRADVGKFFKYRNCYSCPSKPSDYWFLYAAVFAEGSSVKAFGFQTDKNGHTSFEVDGWSGLHGYVEITRKEFMTAYSKAILSIRREF